MRLQNGARHKVQAHLLQSCPGRHRTPITMYMDGGNAGLGIHAALRATWRQLPKDLQHSKARQGGHPISHSACTALGASIENPCRKLVGSLSTPTHRTSVSSATENARQQIPREQRRYGDIGRRPPNALANASASARVEARAIESAGTSVVECGDPTRYPTIVPSSGSPAFPMRRIRSSRSARASCGRLGGEQENASATARERATGNATVGDSVTSSLNCHANASDFRRSTWCYENVNDSSNRRTT